MPVAQHYWHGSGCYTPPFNIVAGAVAGWSVRRLSSSYAGACMRVYETGFGLSTDIGFVGCGDLDQTALAAWVGPNPNVGYVQGWYDQTGNVNDLGQAASPLMPVIRQAGSNITRNSIPMPTFNNTGTGRRMVCTSILGGNYTIFAVVYSSTATTTLRTIVGGGLTSSFTVRIGDATSSKVQLLRATVASVLVSSGNTPSGGLTQIYASGGSIGTQTVGIDGVYTTSVGGQTYAQIDGIGYDFKANTAGYDDCIAEVLIYNSVLSSGDRDLIVANQKAYFGTP